MTHQSIFEYLTAKSICFSVCVSTKEANNVSLDGNSKDYFILVKKDDIRPKVKHRWQFKSCNDDQRVFMRDLTTFETYEFKGMNDKFSKVIHKACGRVYELKESSFKIHLEMV